MPRTDKDNAGWLPGYRGYVDHGVYTPDYEPEESGYAETPGLTEFANPVPEVDPIAVKIISDPSPRHIREWRVAKYLLIANQAPVRIAGYDPNRKSLQINVQSNAYQGICFIGPDSTVNRMNGYDIIAGGSGNFSTTAINEVWMTLISPDYLGEGEQILIPDPITVAAVIEYEVEI